MVVGGVVVVVVDVEFGTVVEGVVVAVEFGEVVVVDPFGVAPGAGCVLDGPVTSELRFKVAALEWNENSPTKPATVPEMTIGARFIPV